MFTEAAGKIATIHARREVEVNGEKKFVNVPIYKSEERSLCICCGKRKHTTVNGVCLDCTTS